MEAPDFTACVYEILGDPCGGLGRATFHDRDRSDRGSVCCNGETTKSKQCGELCQHVETSNLAQSSRSADDFEWNGDCSGNQTVKTSLFQVLTNVIGSSERGHRVSMAALGRKGKREETHIIQMQEFEEPCFEQHVGFRDQMSHTQSYPKSPKESEFECRLPCSMGPRAFHEASIRMRTYQGVHSVISPGSYQKKARVVHTSKEHPRALLSSLKTHSPIYEPFVPK